MHRMNLMLKNLKQYIYSPSSADMEKEILNISGKTNATEIAKKMKTIYSVYCFKQYTLVFSY